MLKQDNRMEEKMITRHKSKPIIKPSDVKPSHETSYSDTVEFKSSDPEVILKDTCAIVYKRLEYLSTMSHNIGQK